MANFSVSGVEIQAIAAAVPQQIVATEDSPLLETAQEQQHFIKNVGIAHLLGVGFYAKKIRIIFLVFFRIRWIGTIRKNYV